MPIDVRTPRIPPDIVPGVTVRELLANHFSDMGELPIKGGWGYSIDDAVIIDKNDPVAPKGVPFHGVGFEYIFVEKRIYEELIILPPEHKQCSGIEWKLQGQRTFNENDRQFDVLEYEVTAVPNKDWEELKDKWEGPTGYGSPGFDVEAHQREHDSKTIRYITEYWFDITSFYSSSNH